MTVSFMKVGKYFQNLYVSVNSQKATTFLEKEC